MEQEIRERILSILQINRISQTAFAKEVGMSQNTVNRQLNEATITANLITAIAQQFPTVSMEWLIRGTAPIFLSGIPSETTINTPSIDEADALASAMSLIKQQAEFIHKQATLISMLKGQIK